MTHVEVYPTSYGYAVSWGEKPTGDSMAMVTFSYDGIIPDVFICRRCCDAACEHVQAAIDHRATETGS